MNRTDARVERSDGPVEETLPWDEEKSRNENAIRGAFRCRDRQKGTSQNQEGTAQPAGSLRQHPRIIDE